MYRSLLKWELLGAVAIFLVGSGFHFLFEAAGNWPPLGVFVPVNESVFEHLKLTFWPTVLYGAVSYKFLSTSSGSFFIARAVSLYIMPLVIIILFYGYTALFGIESVIIDILIFFIAVVCGQLVSYSILKSPSLPAWLTGLSLFFIAVLALLYAFFTFYPPYTGFFLDSPSGTYGIPQ